MQVAASALVEQVNEGAYVNEDQDDNKQHFESLEKCIFITGGMVATCCAASLPQFILALFIFGLPIASMFDAVVRERRRAKKEVAAAEPCQHPSRGPDTA